MEHKIKPCSTAAGQKRFSVSSDKRLLLTWRKARTCARAAYVTAAAALCLLGCNCYCACWAATATVRLFCMRHEVCWLLVCSPRLPKKKKFVSSLHTSPFLNMRCALK